MKPFKIRNADWKSIPVDSIIFILSEAKDYLDYTISESDKITTRAYSIVLLLFAILSGIIGFTFKELATANFSKILMINFCLSFTIVFLLYHLGHLVFPRKIMAKGRIPKELALPQFLTNSKLSKEENYLALIIQEVENCQKKIDFNLLKNEHRQKRLKNIMMAIAVLFPLYLALTLLVTI